MWSSQSWNIRGRLQNLYWWLLITYGRRAIWRRYVWWICSLYNRFKIWKVDADGLAKEQSHVTEFPQEYLHVLFNKHKELFSDNEDIIHRGNSILRQNKDPNLYIQGHILFHIYIKKNLRKNSTIPLRLVSWTFKEPVNKLVLLLFKQKRMAVFAGSAIYEL